MDNASTDDTAELVKSYRLANMPVRHVYEPQRGKGYAYNAGMAAAQGDVFLFTDDDVRPPINWIEGMCRPILSGEADAVAGGVKFAPHLERPWMKSAHYDWLASTLSVNAQQPNRLVGANMAFTKSVLSKVPRFDTELGPGAIGFGDETLFSWQLIEAGYSLQARLDVEVEHHFNPDRLSRKSFASAAKKHGSTVAYLNYHWQHDAMANVRLHLIKRSARLQLRRFMQRREILRHEAMPDWEMEMLLELSFYKQYLIEQKRPRNYEKRGLVKRI